MKNLLRLFALILALAVPALSTPAHAQELTPEEVKRLALEAILENPEIVLEAVAIVREREEAAKQQAAEDAITQLRDMLENDPNAPVMGNPDGDVTVVEFFDYNCPYCKRSAAAIQELLEADPNIRLVMREWPILGEGSVFASLASLAAREQGKYEEFHFALMLADARKDEGVVRRIARDIGLDMDLIEAHMEDEAVTRHLQDSDGMARALGFTGTPSFVIGGQAIYGFVPMEDMQAAVEAVRAEAAQ